ncbi:hypothetical protein BCR36DRAFT_401550 [Piromyces finnis]|uniref:Coiled-coil domain-containing protein 84 n=1 Tax=Piromyces finnis TaxID=1754191 RepID=A0A1Y1VM29_9FUNG|nr:hypothetical protein BCR36DRAFT_401550 [Piromyces finnis]|eukprot:ORX59985.1 hypothetical protein BCR36DRAFT_401550 [Piromyces finnis]
MEYNFFFCEICNRNQEKNKRHVYSKGHRKRLDFLLTRQNEKFSKLLTFLNNIKIVEDDVEQPEIWCLFCKTTIKSSNSKIACKHIFLHMTYESHIDSIDEFWKEQRPSKKKWEKKQFYLNKTVINDFLKKSDIELNEYKKKQLLPSNNIDINYSESINDIKVSNKGNNYINDKFDIGNEVRTNSSKNSDINDNIPYQTVQAFGENLTCLNINPNQNIINNIHNDNSTPPWMLDNSESESNSEDEKLNIKLNINKKKNNGPIVGPSLDLYMDYKEKKRKSKLNPKRLGNTIDRDKKISKNWMPNFGGIWNSGPRSTTRKEFLNKLKKKNE